MNKKDFIMQVKFLNNNKLSPPEIAKRLGSSVQQVYHAINQLTRENFSNDAKNVLYHSKEWKLMREMVLSRDGHKCVRCGAENSWKNALQVQHVKSKSYYPELAFNLENLMTLCVKCHKKSNNYGNKAKTLGRKLS